MEQEQEQINNSSERDVGGQGPTTTANVGQGPTASPGAAHTLSSKDVAKLFEEAGIPRSQRSVERYCKAAKLDCIVDPDEEHWYASKESVDLLIGQLKELQARHQSSEAGAPLVAQGQRREGPGPEGPPYI